MHDSCVVVSLLKAISIVLTVKILVICKLAKGLAPWASVWCGGEWANAYRLKSLTGGSYANYCVRTLHHGSVYTCGRKSPGVGSRASGMQGSLDTGTAWPYYRPASRTR